MYYRRKILLSLLQVFNGELDKICFQKLLFLVAQQQKVPAFHFVPYKFGCFSFQANADLMTLGKYELTSESDKSWKKTDSKDYLPELNFNDKSAVLFVKNHYGTLSNNELLRLTYIKYPFYAINSTVLTSVLNSEEMSLVKRQIPVGIKTTLFTIGYEGISLEQYINKLIYNDIKVLCDVRKNALSMKYGFSKNQLKTACTGVGIEYLHIPELGIETDKRQQLDSQLDYDILFEFYKKNILINQNSKINFVFELLKRKQRIALTCFEANIHQCHRKHLAEDVGNLNGFEYEIKHI